MEYQGIIGFENFNRGNGLRNIIIDRLNEENVNYQGCAMTVVEYNKAIDINVEFQDEYKARVHTDYRCFKKGKVKNPYYPEVYGVGMIGNKYTTGAHSRHIKEYNAWIHMLERCYNDTTKQKFPTYKDATCCVEWFLYENFYEWLHSQENFEKWFKGKGWAIDKDIISKGNKIYSPKTCCLVPQNVNSLFVQKNATRGELPIGVSKNYKNFSVSCQNPLTGRREYLGTYKTMEDAFLVYKKYKENLIKQISNIEYSKGNISKQCYDAMMKYEIEITD